MPSNSLLLQEVFKKIVDNATEETILELYNIIHSEDYESKEVYSFVCKEFNFDIGDSGKPIIDNSNVIYLSCIALVILMYSETDDSYPIFFNQQRENFSISYIQDDLFSFDGFELSYDMEFNIEEKFYKSLRNVGNIFIIDIDSIFKILEYYIQSMDVSIAINDFITDSKSNNELLCNFNISEKLQENINNVDSEVAQVIVNMASQHRLDFKSLSVLMKSLEKNEK